MEDAHLARRIALRIRLRRNEQAARLLNEFLCKVEARTWLSPLHGGNENVVLYPDGRLADNRASSELSGHRHRSLLGP